MFACEDFRFQIRLATGEIQRFKGKLRSRAVGRRFPLDVTSPDQCLRQGTAPPAMSRIQPPAS